jgi:hypothetical protein
MRHKFEHPMANKENNERGGKPEWFSDDDKVLVTKLPNGLEERCRYYTERNENGELEPALPPNARKEENEIFVKKNKKPTDNQ